MEGWQLVDFKLVYISIPGCMLQQSDLFWLDMQQEEYLFVYDYEMSFRSVIALSYILYFSRFSLIFLRLFSFYGVSNLLVVSKQQWGNKTPAGWAAQGN